MRIAATHGSPAHARALCPNLRVARAVALIVTWPVRLSQARQRQREC